MIGPIRRNLIVLKRVAGHPIHRGRRVSAVLRWLRLWGALHLTPARQVAVPFVDGAILNWPAASTSVNACARYGLGEFADMAFCLHVLRPEDLFCDVGANAGVYTVLAGHAVGCRAVAIEPVPQTFNLLMQNIYANNLAGLVDARMLGLGRQPDQLSFTSHLWSFNHVAPKGAGTIEVPVERLDTVLDSRVPFALKIDVEGYEAEVLAGAAQTLQSVQAVLIEMHDPHLAKYGASVAGVEQTLLGAGLSGPFQYDPSTRQLRARAGGGYNNIYVRDPEEVAARLTNSRAYAVNGTQV